MENKTPSIPEQVAPVSETTQELDEKIASLEKRNSELLKTREELLSGKVAFELDLGNLMSENEENTQIQIRHKLAENPLFAQLVASHTKRAELLEELIVTGELTLPTKIAKQPNRKRVNPLKKALILNEKINLQARRKTGKFGKLLGSPWLFLIGLACLMLAGGMNLLTGDKTATPNLPTTPQTPLTTPLKTLDDSPKLTKIDYRPNFFELVTPPTEPQLSQPHGQFLAPSRLKIEAVGLDLPIIKAITHSETNPTELKVGWPAPGEVVHLGAFPGEIGNLILLANQVNLSPLRRIQLNDTVTVFDRHNNAYLYQIIPFSPAGEPERQVSLNLDSWIFEPSDEAALLTIVVNLPQARPLTVLSESELAALGERGLEARAAEKNKHDDYATPYKLAYRAVLVAFNPAKTAATPIGTRVAVPPTVYTVRPATNTFSPPDPTEPAKLTNQPSATPTPLATLAPPATPILPRMPQTGKGGGAP